MGFEERANQLLLFFFFIFIFLLFSHCTARGSGHPQMYTLQLQFFPPPFLLLRHEYLDIVLNAIQQDLSFSCELHYPFSQYFYSCPSKITNNNNSCHYHLTLYQRFQQAHPRKGNRRPQDCKEGKLSLLANGRYCIFLNS